MYYKYLPINRLSYLENELLRFTQPGDLNDPFECLPQKPTKAELQSLVLTISQSFIGTDLVKKVGNNKFLEQIEAYVDAIQQGTEGNLLDNVFSSAQDNTNKSIGIFSLSKNWNSTLMWSHYTDSHKGFCIGFNPHHLFFKNFISDDSNSSLTTLPVKYSTDRVKVPMIQGMKKLGFEPYITKSVDWQYEEEIRVISTLNLSYKIVEGEMYSINLFKVPHSAITEIILGANISPSDKETIIIFCKKHKIKLYQSMISNIKYDMERELNDF